MAKVLVVDDHPDTRDVMVQLLGMHGHRVDACGTGEEALQAIGADPPDAVICDERLPGMTGVELLHAIRHDPRFVDMQVVICSAADSPRESALHAGANEFWLKGSETLLDSVERFGDRLRRIPAKA